MKTILVVDDDLCMRETLTHSLEYEGYVVIAAECGCEAMEILRRNSVDLILSDIQMPNGDGFELLRELRLSSEQHPPLIFVSGNPDVSEAQLVALGATRFFPKPFAYSELLHAVRFLLALPPTK